MITNRIDGYASSVSVAPHTFVPLRPTGKKTVFHPTAEIGIELCERGDDGYSDRTMRVFNDTERESDVLFDPYIVDEIFPCEREAHLHTLHGEDCSQNGFLPIERTFSVGDTWRMTPNGGRSSSTSGFPIFDLTLDGAVYLFAIGWTGQWRVEIRRDETSVRVRIGMCYADFYLKPHESFMLPSVCVMRGTDVAETRRRFRRHLMRFRPFDETDRNLPIAIQPFDRYFYGKLPEWVTEAGQFRVLEKAKACGCFDAFWIDAAWFHKGFPCGAGNYSYAEGFPNGLAPISDAAHRAGMKFVLWFEPERVYRDTEVRAEHPEFLLASDISPRLFDLGNEDAWNWLFATLSRLIRENGVDVFRQDFNMDPLPFWLENDEPRRHGVREIGHVNGFYRLWDALRAEFPHLLIDNCASGGRRIDYETLQRSVPLWRSDVTCFPISAEKPCDIWNQNQTLALSEYLPYQCSAAWEPVANDVRSAATMGFSGAFDILNENFDMQGAKKALDEVAHLACYWEGDFYPLTKPTLSSAVFAAFQLAKEGSGYAAIFRRETCAEATFLLRLHGIDADADYEVTLTDEHYEKTQTRVRGKALIEGYPVTLAMPRSSAILEYEKI